MTLHSGKNHLALTLANGWYKGKLGFMPQPARLFDYGFDTLIFQLPGRFLVDNFCRADGGEHRCGRSVSTAPEAAYLLPCLGAAMITKGNPLHIKYINKAIPGMLANVSPDGRVLNVSGGTAVMKDADGYRGISRDWIQGWGQGLALAFFAGVLNYDNIRSDGAL